MSVQLVIDMNLSVEWYSALPSSGIVLYTTKSGANSLDGVNLHEVGRGPFMNEREVNGELILDAERPPLRIDEGGAVRVGNSRITLDLIVEQYENGMTPEDMVRAYDTLALADVYAVIAYYHRHREEVRAYLRKRQEEAEALQAKVEVKHPPLSREELQTRQAAREKVHAPTGQ